MRVIDSHLIEPYTQIIDRISSCQKFLNAGENFIARAGASRFSIIQCSPQKFLLLIVYFSFSIAIYENIFVYMYYQKERVELSTQKREEYIFFVRNECNDGISLQIIRTRSETLIQNKYLLLFFFLILIKQPRRPISFPTRLFW